MSAPAGHLLLVFTDLDGSLLDHNSYSYLDARPQLRALERQGVPVIPASSKTRVEIEQLRLELGNDNPFIMENGAAVAIPVGYFPSQPADTVEREGYWVREMSPSRERWLELLAQLLVEFPEQYNYFARAGSAAIARMTGLSLSQAELANQREYSEPVQWLGSEQRKAQFIDRLRAAGATVLQGGRFLGVSGDCDKGRALQWLREVYRQNDPGAECHDLAIGDSGNDCAMLEAAESALLVRSPVHDFPPLSRNSGVMRSRAYGPAGWAEGVARWLQCYPPQQ